MRLFVAIDLDDAARAAIGDEQNRLMRAFGPLMARTMRAQFEQNWPHLGTYVESLGSHR